MKTTSILLIVISTITLSAALQLTEGYTFANYIKDFNKVYKDESEHLQRELIFNENVKIINLINSTSKTGKAGLNHLTDRTKAELEAIRGYNSKLIKSKSVTFLETPDINVTDLPKSVDYRDKGVINPVKDQGHCGSCWAFSTIANVEAHLALNTGKLLNLSEQQLVSCVQNPNHCGGSGGCDGAIEQLGFNYIKENGIALNESYPYQAETLTCNTELASKKVAIVDGYVQLTKNSNSALLHTLANVGPVSVGVDATNFHLYESGVWSNCGSTINHGVLVVGYGVDPKEGAYWLVRNSWGPHFGENGYIRIARDLDDNDVKCAVDENPEDGSACAGDTEKPTVCGTCGILFENTYPTGAKLIE
jgi:cathepsin L